MKKKLTIATRGSQLALWQAELVKNRLQALHSDLEIVLDIVKTQGDLILDQPLHEIGGKGLFIKEIEEHVLSGKADLAVHSIKDMQTELETGLILGACLEREDPSDLFLSFKYPTFEDLPQGATIGTGSLRRKAQILHRRSDLKIAPLRGNVDTRLRKLEEGEFDAVILASAGVRRLGLSAPHMQTLDPLSFIPAVGQGAIGIEIREDDYDLMELIEPLNHRETQLCVEAERSFLDRLQGDCKTPIAAHAYLIDDGVFLKIHGFVASLDGKNYVRHMLEGGATDSYLIGTRLADFLLMSGAGSILAMNEGR
ncbi:MAG: hydroxymethylbilane synthase [Desulfovibrionaceae bacterium]|nr:hydroxymethylbilane synthase [Desulfovibrionaceae bacterium]